MRRRTLLVDLHPPLCIRIQVPDHGLAAALRGLDAPSENLKLIAFGPPEYSTFPAVTARNMRRASVGGRSPDCLGKFDGRGSAGVGLRSAFWMSMDPLRLINVMFSSTRQF
jgi:hypothetical protein